MPRLLELFAKRGLVPQRWTSALIDGARLEIEIESAGIAATAVGYLADCMRGIVGVERVAAHFPRG